MTCGLHEKSQTILSLSLTYNYPLSPLYNINTKQHLIGIISQILT